MPRCHAQKTECRKFPVTKALNGNLTHPPTEETVDYDPNCNCDEPCQVELPVAPRQRRAWISAAQTNMPCARDDQFMSTNADQHPPTHDAIAHSGPPLWCNSVYETTTHGKMGNPLRSVARVIRPWNCNHARMDGEAPWRRWRQGFLTVRFRQGLFGPNDELREDLLSLPPSVRLPARDASRKRSKSGVAMQAGAGSRAIGLEPGVAPRRARRTRSNNCKEHELPRETPASVSSSCSREKTTPWRARLRGTSADPRQPVAAGASPWMPPG